MNTGWKQIGEEILSLYQEMEYHADYDIGKFEKDLEIARGHVFIPKNSSKDQEIVDSGDSSISRYSSFRFSTFRDLFEWRRSILTKLFFFTNNPNGVDTLIKYCDYYTSYYDLYTENNGIPVRVPIGLILLRSVFMMLAKNERTEKILSSVWTLLVTDIGQPDLRDRVDSTFPNAPGSLAMIIMSDSDLNAAIHALMRSRQTYFQVSKILVQEPIKEKLSIAMENYGCEIEILSNFYVFRNTTEALENLNGKDKFKAVSIWSENIIGAKKFAANLEVGCGHDTWHVSLQICTIWINAHGVFDAGFHSLLYVPGAVNDTSFRLKFPTDESEDHGNFPNRVKKTYDLFYGGKWHRSSDEKYSTNQEGDFFAEATKTDFVKCAKTARGAFKLWRSKKLSQRANVIRSFAERLEANGEFEYADIILQLANRPLDIGGSFSIAGDGEAEILSTMEPVGVLLITARDQKTLFAKLAIAIATGNAVIILLEIISSVSFVKYCDLLASCGFPPGLINCLFTSTEYIVDLKIIDNVLGEPTDIFLNKKLTMFNKDKAYENIIYNHFFAMVTKPKSIWLQCA